MILNVSAALVCLAASVPEPSATELVGPAARTKYVNAWSSKDLSLVWQVPTVRAGMFRTVVASQGTPAIVAANGELVILGTGEGNVLALSARTGDVRWRYRYGLPFIGAATVVTDVDAGINDTLVILGADDGYLLALRVADGQLRWRVDAGGPVRAPVSAAGNRLVAATANNKLLVVDTSRGTVIWTKARPRPTSLVIDAHPRPAVDRDRVYAGFADGYIEAHKLEDGALIWSRPLAATGGQFVDAAADPVVFQDRVFVASYTAGIFALDRHDGATLWQRRAPAVTALAYEAGVLLAGSADGYVWGLEPTTGGQRFRTVLPNGPVSRINVDGGLAALTAGDTGLVILSAVDGKPIEAFSVGGRATAEPAWSHDFVAVLAENGDLFGLRRHSPPK